MGRGVETHWASNQAHREAEGLSQAAVARKAGIHAAMLSRIERDESSDPYFSTIAKVAAVLGLSLDELAAEAGLPSVRRVRRGLRGSGPAPMRRSGDGFPAPTRAQDRLARARNRKLG